MALFMVQTGVRDEECCGLCWDWQQEVEDLGVSVFVIPADASKNGIERAVVLNAVAHKVIEEQRAKRMDDCPWVFPYRGTRIQMMNNNGWQAARKTAAALYKAKLDKECPQGFRTLHVHDLRHTFGRRLRAAGVSNETRQDLLGHKNGNITTHYSAAELFELLRAVKLVETGSSAPLLRRVA